jgi:peptide deformylase
MTVRPIVRFGDPVLITPTAPVTSFGEPTRKLVRDLLDTVDAPGHAGVAATQIGVGLRAFSYNVEGRIGHILNPELVEVSAQTQDGEEGCLSIPGLYLPTVRGEYAVVRGVDQDNEPVTLEGSGLMARCLQHETDHLDGMLYIDRLDRDLRRSALRSIRESDWFLASGRQTASPGLPGAFGG